MHLNQPEYVISEIAKYLHQGWSNFTDMLWWKSLIGFVLSITVGTANIQLFAALLIVSFVDFILVLVGIFWKHPGHFQTKKVITWGVKIFVYWIVITAFNYISMNIDFVAYLTKTIIYIYIFTEALSIIRNDIKFGLTKAKYPDWLMVHLQSELSEVHIDNITKKTRVKITQESESDSIPLSKIEEE